MLFYADAGGGTQFGEGIHQAGIVNTFALNSSALASLNANDSVWAIGGQNTTVNPTAGDLRYAFGYSGGPCAGCATPRPDR